SRPSRSARASSGSATEPLDGHWLGAVCSIARCAYRCRARSWPPSARKTIGATGPRWAIPRALRRKTVRRPWARRRVSVIMSGSSRGLEGRGFAATCPVAALWSWLEGDDSGADGVDVGHREVEIDVAAWIGALGQGWYAVADQAGIGDGSAAERAIDDQAEVLGLQALAGVGMEAEAEAVDGARRFAGDPGDRAFETGLGDVRCPRRPDAHPDPPGHERPASREWRGPV